MFLKKYTFAILLSALQSQKILNLLRLASQNSEDISYKGTNSLINYRLKNFKASKNYLHRLLSIEKNKAIIFYASDPSKEQSQRFMTELFLMEEFSSLKDHILVLKTHPQDNGKITDYAYQSALQPSNVILIGDATRAGSLVSKNFRVFDNFDFNSAVASSNGFLTFSSSSILQALNLGVKTGVVDKFENGFYDYLINLRASFLIHNKETLDTSLLSKNLKVSDTLSFCGLQNLDEEFDVGVHLLRCLQDFKEGNL